MQTEELFSSVCYCSIFIANLPETKSGFFFWQNDSGLFFLLYKFRIKMNFVG